MNQELKAWLTRSGKYGERDAWALEHSVTPGGFGEVPDLSGCQSLDDVKNLVAGALQDASTNAVGNFAAQLWALSGRMAVGDFAVLPLKTTSQVAIGRITGDYEFRSDQADLRKAPRSSCRMVAYRHPAHGDQTGPFVLARRILYLLPDTAQ